MQAAKNVVRVAALSALILSFGFVPVHEAHAVHKRHGTTKKTSPHKPAAGKAGTKRWQRATMAAYRGIRFSDNKVVDSDDKSADVAFPLHPTSLGFPGAYNPAMPFVYLDAPKAKGFDSAPNTSKISRAEVETWEDQALDVAPGRYFVVKTPKNQYALLKVVSFTDRTKDYHFWKLTVAWQLLNLKP